MTFCKSRHRHPVGCQQTTETQCLGSIRRRGAQVYCSSWGRALKLSCTQSSIRYVTHQEFGTQPQHDLSPVHVSAGILCQHDDDDDQGTVPGPPDFVPAEASRWTRRWMRGVCGAEFTFGRLLLAKTLCQSFQSSRSSLPRRGKFCV